MREFLKRAEARATKWLVGLFMPDLARQMQAEGLFEQPVEGVVPEYMVVEDQGADITIFSFSGFDILYAGFARYEFRRVLNEIGCKANLVFIRDPNRMGFHVAPDGQPNGLTFFEAEINRVKEQLGARHNVAVGSSSGGSAALWFASRCNFNEAVIFGAALTAEGFCKPAHVCATLLNLRQLLREPSGYFEMLVVTLGAWWGGKPLLKKFGRDGLMDPLTAYGEAHPNAPKITYYYGARAFTDAWHAGMMARYEGVRLVPLPTGRHNTPAFLKERGQLAMALQAGMTLAQ